MEIQEMKSDDLIEMIYKIRSELEERGIIYNIKT